MKMEEIAFSDWPGQPVDLNAGNNPWLPAYGFQTPSALLEKEDFIGNPDAEYFLQGNVGHYMYLETIQEETSDDLRSESDVESRGSPVGWLATDSETGSVICIDGITDEVECESDREVACPAKRRKQEIFLTVPINLNSDEELQSLSRSSSLLQFETLEKQCQETCSNSSPSIYSQFSFDSLEVYQKNNNNLSPDSLDNNCIPIESIGIIEDYSSSSNSSEYYKSLKIDVPLSTKAKEGSRDSLLYNASARYSASDDGTSDSDETLHVTRSFDNLKTWRSFDSLQAASRRDKNPKEKVSVENLSEDSGYSEHLTKCSSSGMRSQQDGIFRNSSKSNKIKNSYVGFSAYDGDVFNNFQGNFGVSYQDLSVFETEVSRSPLVDIFMRNKRAVVAATPTAISPKITNTANVGQSKNNWDSAPNLLHITNSSNDNDDDLVSLGCTVQVVAVTTSVPKDLNLVGCGGQQFEVTSVVDSVAVKNLNLFDLTITENLCSRNESDYNSLNINSHNLNEMAEKTYKREGSYAKAMTNRVDLSDDEQSLCYDARKKRSVPKTTIEVFDKKVLKAISETSLQSLKLGNSNTNLSIAYEPPSTPLTAPPASPRSSISNSFLTSTPKRNVISTPNLALMRPYFEDDRRQSVQDIQEIHRKTSVVKSSASTSGMSDIEDRTLTSVKSFSSTNSKGVHFSPVVSEVNWRDDSVSTATVERESTYSLSSASDRELTPPPTPKLLRSSRESGSREKYVASRSPARGLSVSQPDLSDTESCKKDFVNSLKSLQKSDLISRSQPDVSKMKRRGSQLIKKDKDGCIIKAYVDGDGIQYKHTHLDLEMHGYTSNNKPSETSLPNALHATASIAAATVTPYDHQQQFFAASSSMNRAFGSNSSGIASSGGGTITTNFETFNRDGHQQRPVSAMEAYNTHRKDAANSGGGGVNNKQRSGSGKLGGFFSRLASFRFSARKSADEKAKLKKKNQENSKNTAINLPSQRIATKEDYIYIPLKSPNNQTNSTTTPSNNNINNNNLSNSTISAKPPLPKQPPPRIVHASVKKDQQHQQQHYGVALAPAGSADPEGEAPRHRHHRRRTIDSCSAGPPMEPMGLIETDLDTEVTVITSGAHAKTRSLLNLGTASIASGAEPRLLLSANDSETSADKRHPNRPHKSMEFLLDKQNLKVVEPPENELQKGERVMSEHQLRVQRSLQKLTVPDWFKQAQVPREGFLLKKQTTRESRWTGTGSKTTSLSSLTSNSPVILSPTPITQPFVRWSTSKLNSTASSPCASTRSSFNARQPNGSISPSSIRSSFSYRQPYLGWRSQERLSRPRTPAERLASTILSHHPPPAQPQESPEIQTSIKEVTSAIVHYVSGLRPDEARDRSYDSQETASQRSLSVSPRGSQKFCWLESSFVGTKPLDSPQTPVTLSESQSVTPVPPMSLRLDLHNDMKLLTTATTGIAASGSTTSSGLIGTSMKPSPSSTTLEDVLDSLLGLPASGRAPSPSLQVTESANTSPNHNNDIDNYHQNYLQQMKSESNRRQSDGSDTSTISVATSRRVSLNSSPVLRCRYSRCGRTAIATSTEATTYKNCHNCTYTYCSRSCRRAHWEKHRKTCLFSRIGTLCRQVIATSKENKDCLAHLSTIARRGCLSHGPGAVKCFFANPETAERFLANGLPSLGELTYIRWQDLLPSEMGPQLYAELVKMCKNYNTDTKLVLYVSVCVVSETPASGAVKWERQLVSRCAKMRLSKDIQQIVPASEQESPETLIFVCPPIRSSDSDQEVIRLRQTAVANLQKHLMQYGVLLRRQYPEIYKQLQLYCEGGFGGKFTPVTVYPKDAVTGKSFMCIIMLEAETDSLRQVQTVGVKIRTVDVLNYPFSD